MKNEPRVLFPEGRKEPVMFEQAFESFRTATETGLHMQQEMFKKWLALWPGVPVSVPNFGEPFRQFPKKWAESVGELLKRQREVMETQFKAGLEGIEKAFRLGEAKTVEELRARTLELWQKCFETLKKTYEAQLIEFQAAMDKWAELVTKPAA
jgi:hypothetical protein